MKYKKIPPDPVAWEPDVGVDISDISSSESESESEEEQEDSAPESEQSEQSEQSEKSIKKRKISTRVKLKPGPKFSTILKEDYHFFPEILPL